MSSDRDRMRAMIPSASTAVPVTSIKAASSCGADFVLVEVDSHRVEDVVAEPGFVRLDADVLQVSPGQTQ
jgi:hypothetical protein